MYKKIITIVVIIGICIALLLSCAPGLGKYTRDESIDADKASFGRTASFFDGLLHGFGIIVFFIWSWFDTNVMLYETANNGFGYNFGFFLGAWLLLHGVRTSAPRRHRQKNNETDISFTGHKIKIVKRKDGKSNITQISLPKTVKIKTVSDKKATSGKKKATRKKTIKKNTVHSTKKATSKKTKKKTVSAGKNNRTRKRK